jgi:hypothetical protein
MEETNVTKSLVLEYKGNKKWNVSDNYKKVDIVALFRDPKIKDDRPVEYVLDIKIKNGKLTAGKNCWVKDFVDDVIALRINTTVAIENGVNIPCPKENKFEKYFELLRNNYGKYLKNWIKEFYNNNNELLVIICDKDHLNGLIKMEAISNNDKLLNYKRYLDIIGEEFLLFNKIKCLVFYHPIVIKYKPEYRTKSNFVIHKINERIKNNAN